MLLRGACVLCFSLQIGSVDEGSGNNGFVFGVPIDINRMKTGKAKILVIGGGVNGSACAAALHDGGVDVTVLERGERYDQIRSDGLIIDSPFRVPFLGSVNPSPLGDGMR